MAFFTLAICLFLTGLQLLGVHGLGDAEQSVIIRAIDKDILDRGDNAFLKISFSDPDVLERKQLEKISETLAQRIVFQFNFDRQEIPAAKFEIAVQLFRDNAGEKFYFGFHALGFHVKAGGARTVAGVLFDLVNGAEKAARDRITSAISANRDKPVLLAGLVDVPCTGNKGCFK